MSSTEISPQRRRGKALEKALLDATWEELRTVGYKQLTFESVARRAGTSKSVLYRRWSHRLDLVRATLRAYRPLLSGPVPDTGSLRGDILALLEHMASGMREVPDIVWGMAADAMSEHLHESFRNEITASNIKTMTAILQKAQARGEIATTSIPNRLITLPIDLTRHEMLVGGHPPSEHALIQIVDEIYIPILKTRY